jgi:hypothetical protein
LVAHLRCGPTMSRRRVWLVKRVTRTILRVALSDESGWTGSSYSKSNVPVHEQLTGLASAPTPGSSSTALRCALLVLLAKAGARQAKNPTSPSAAQGSHLFRKLPEAADGDERAWTWRRRPSTAPPTTAAPVHTSTPRFPSRPVPSSSPIVPLSPASGCVSN